MSHQQRKILGSESFTKWLIWDTSASARDSASARELGKLQNFCIPNTWECIKFKKSLPASRIWVSLPPMIVHTTQAAFTFK